MRRLLTLIATGFTVVALFVAGFALFAPAESVAPATSAKPDLTLPSGRGLASGRLATMSFSAVASTLEAPIAAGPDSDTFEGLLFATLRQEELATGPQATTTTTSTVPATTTTSTTTTTPPTTTAPPISTTTTSSSTTTTTVPVSTTTTVPTSGPLTESQMRELAARFFPSEEVDKAVLVARCESGFNPAAYNSSGPYGGLYQHLETHWETRAAAAGYPGASIFNAEANTAAAHLLWSSNGWGPWPSCSAWADGQLGG